MRLSHGYRRGCRQTAAAIAVGLLIATPLQASSTQQVAQFTAWDALPGDGFGRSVALTGQRVLIGAPNRGHTPGSGSAYLYDQPTGEPLFALLADDATVSDQFGAAVGLMQNTAIIGAPFGGSDQSPLSGAAYLYDARTGDQLHKLNPPGSEALDHFGAAVAVTVQHAVVGAPADNTPDGIDAGSAHVFNAITGAYQRSLRPLDASPGAGFGTSIALHGSTALIGAHQDSLSAPHAGAAYGFDFTEGRQLFKLSPQDPAEDALFGSAVALHNSLAAVGAPGGASTQTPGAVYIFDVINNTQLHKLTAEDGSVGDGFGASVAIGEGFVIVGATLGATDASSLAGAAYVFDINTGEQLAKLATADTQAIDFFGASVAAHQHATAIGAHGRNTPAGVDAGAAYLFDLVMPPTILGDLDGDGFVGIADLNLVIGNWNQTVPIGEKLLGDVSADGFVGIEDLSLVLADWNAGTPPAAQPSAAIPSPATCFWLGLCVCFSLTRRRSTPGRA